MTVREKEIMAIATQLLAGMVSNPHIYTMVSEEDSQGHQERLLIFNAVRMAEKLVENVKHT